MKLSGVDAEKNRQYLQMEDESLDETLNKNLCNQYK